MSQDTHIEGLEGKLIYWRYTPAFAAEVAELFKRQELIDLIPAYKALQEEVERLETNLTSARGSSQYWYGEAMRNGKRIAALEAQLSALQAKATGDEQEIRELKEIRASLAERNTQLFESVAALQAGGEAVGKVVDTDMLGFSPIVRWEKKLSPGDKLYTAPAIKQQVAECVPESVKLAMLQAHSALESEYRVQTRATEAQRAANATCGKSPGGASSIALLAESGYISSLGKKNIAARDALFAALRDYPTHPVSANQPDSGKVPESCWEQAVREVFAGDQYGLSMIRIIENCAKRLAPSAPIAEGDKCKKCGDVLTGHEDESGSICRWCGTGWAPTDESKSKSAALSATKQKGSAES